ncbi:flagellar biosynthesis protein FlgF [Thermodesulfatator autotrophicus]|uniref:Flagellar biosynthesis protein FlgF n=1 Tax=Thermodesulfatator autotrophicus TaxID=1795632 RepID=A0A177EA37_9BACT|nr:flagellar biosynthesis protein FlgF [Thermodesulfatator autotrophicus]
MAMKAIKVNPQLGLLEALEGGRLLIRRLDVTANNLANVSTPGYKRDVLGFREVLMRKFPFRSPDDWRTFKEVTPKTDFQHGPIEHTGNPLDLAIGSEGFFKVETPNGIAYTRAGNFRLDAERRLVTAQGYPVLADGAPVVIDPGLAKGGLTTIENIRFQVDTSGVISIDGTEIGRFDIVTFNDPNKLKKYGENLFVAEEGAQEIPVENPDLRQGYLEGSNVEPLVEMVKLIEIQREFEAIQKSIQRLGDNTSRMIETYGRT